VGNKDRVQIAAGMGGHSPCCCVVLCSVVFVQESQHRQDQVYQRHRLDNIALSFVYQVCHALFVLDSVFW
jgi:hypothetical protein